jgi:hypothetical protein
MAFIKESSKVFAHVPILSYTWPEYQTRRPLACCSTPDALTNPQFKGVRFQAGNGVLLLRVDGVARYHVQVHSAATPNCSFAFFAPLR